MNAEVPPSLLGNSEKETLVDACYFAIRTLRNATRGYRNPAVSTESSEEVRFLAELAISEIETHEGRRIQELPRDRIDDYIVLLEELLRVTYQRAVGQDSGRAASILLEMRSSRLADGTPNV